VNDFSVIQTGLFDVFGGADRVALTLHEQYRSQNINAQYLVSAQRLKLPAVTKLPHEAYRSRWAQKLRAKKPVSSTRAMLAEPLRTLRAWLGYADYDWPASSIVGAAAADAPPAILHFHTPTVRFDLRLLPALSQKYPCILTVHDMLSFTGWCLHSYSCERWKEHCGSCPQLHGAARVPHVTPRDRTRANLRQKQKLYEQSSLFVAAPSQWIAAKLSDSVLAPAIRALRVIPNGVDTKLFLPATAQRRRQLRRELSLPMDALTILMTAVGKQHPFKDARMAFNACEQLARHVPQLPVSLVLIGEMDSPIPTAENLHVTTTGFLAHHGQVARYLQTGDIYLHCTKADTSSLAIIEAQLSGLAVVASRVGGISEIVEDGRSGFLVAAGDAQAAAARLQNLAQQDGLRECMGTRGRTKALACFSADAMAQRYLEYYSEALAWGRTREEMQGVETGNPG
jgi:glycosyltransferase involved in cell wall biosynthesis